MKKKHPVWQGQGQYHTGFTYCSLHWLSQPQIYSFKWGWEKEIGWQHGKFASQGKFVGQWGSLGSPEVWIRLASLAAPASTFNNLAKQINYEDVFLVGLYPHYRDPFAYHLHPHHLHCDHWPGVWKSVSITGVGATAIDQPSHSPSKFLNNNILIIPINS